MHLYNKQNPAIKLTTTNTPSNGHFPVEPGFANCPLMLLLHFMDLYIFFGQNKIFMSLLILTITFREE